MHAVWAQEVYQSLSAHGLDFMSAYVCGRGSSLGDVPSSVVAAAFAVFPLEAIDQLWTDGLGKLERTELIALRDRGVGASLRRVLGDVTTEAEVLEVAETLETAPAGRCSPRCGPRRSWTTRTRDCGGPPTWCASTGATGTWPPASAPGWTVAR
jgi:hypothetical protein